MADKPREKRPPRQRARFRGGDNVSGNAERFLSQRGGGTIVRPDARSSNGKGNGHSSNSNGNSNALTIHDKPSDFQIAPNFGEPVIDLDDIMSMSGSLGRGRIIYENADEAVRFARRDAEKMRRDAVIESALVERMTPVALLDWHLDAGEKYSDHPAVKQMAEEVREIILQTPRLSSLIRTINLAIWHGKYGISNSFNWDFFGDPESGKLQKFLRVNQWQPLHGDSIVPDSEGNIGFKVRRAMNNLTEDQMSRVENATVEGSVIFLSAYERQFYIIHQHEFEAAPFDDARRAGAIHGLGLRDKVFWTWKQKIISFTWLLDFLERFGNGLQIWYYQEGDATSRAEVKTLAQNQSGRTALLVPRPRVTTEQGPGFEHIEVHGSGHDKIWSIVSEYFDGVIRRVIVGQNLSSESAPTGLGSGVAALQRETKQNLILLDAFNLAETLTSDFVSVIVKHNRKNFPHWPKSVKLHWRFEVEDKNVAEAIESAERINTIGGKFDVDDLVERAGLQKPKEGGNVNSGVSQPQPGMGGSQPGMPGEPPTNPPLGFGRLKKSRPIIPVRLEGQWITTDDGNRLYFEDGNLKTKPSGEVVDRIGSHPSIGDVSSDSTTKREVKIPKNVTHEVFIHPDFGFKDEEDFSKSSKKLLGTDSKDKISSLIGAVDDSNVSFMPTDKGITVTCDSDGIESSRKIIKDGDELILFNQSMILSADERGSGKGTKIFYQQVNTAKELGVSKIVCTAERKKHKDPRKSTNGYYTWARLGYDGEVSSLSKKTQDKISKAGFKASKISDLMKTQDGRDFWKKNGESFEATFDLKEGSQSLRIIDEYYKQKFG